MNVNIKYLLDCFFNRLYAGITKFFHFTRICQNQMIVLFVKKRISRIVLVPQIDVFVLSPIQAIDLQCCTRLPG